GRRMLVRNATPTAGKRDSRVTLRYQTRSGISPPDDRARPTRRSNQNSKPIRHKTAKKPERLIAEPNTKIRTNISTSNVARNRIVAIARFFSLRRRACWNVWDDFRWPEFVMFGGPFKSRFIACDFRLIATTRDESGIRYSAQLVIAVGVVGTQLGAPDR